MCNVESPGVIFYSFYFRQSSFTFPSLAVRSSCRIEAWTRWFDAKAWQTSPIVVCTEDNILNWIGGHENAKNERKERKDKNLLEANFPSTRKWASDVLSTLFPSV